MIFFYLLLAEFGKLLYVGWFILSEINSTTFLWNSELFTIWLVISKLRPSWVVTFTSIPPVIGENDTLWFILVGDVATTVVWVFWGFIGGAVLIVVGCDKTVDLFLIVDCKFPNSVAVLVACVPKLFKLLFTVVVLILFINSGV